MYKRCATTSCSTAGSENESGWEERGDMKSENRPPKVQVSRPEYNDKVR